MAYLFSLVCALFIAILETVGLTQFFGSIVYDLQIPLVIAVSIMGRAYKAFITVAVVALVMDTLSGGPFGIYFTTYVWLFFAIQVLSLFINVQAFVPVGLLTLVGVFFENLVFMFVQALSIGAVPNLHTKVLPLVTRQCVIAFITGPFIVWAIGRGHAYLNGLRKVKPELD